MDFIKLTLPCFTLSWELVFLLYVTLFLKRSQSYCCQVVHSWSFIFVFKKKKHLKVPFLCIKQILCSKLLHITLLIQNWFVRCMICLIHLATQWANFSKWRNFEHQCQKRFVLIYTSYIHKVIIRSSYFILKLVINLDSLYQI